jgi:hypothetical protein
MGGGARIAAHAPCTVEICCWAVADAATAGLDASVLDRQAGTVVTYQPLACLLDDPEGTISGVVDLALVDVLAGRQKRALRRLTTLNVQIGSLESGFESPVSLHRLGDVVSRIGVGSSRTYDGRMVTAWVSLSYDGWSWERRTVRVSPAWLGLRCVSVALHLLPAAFRTRYALEWAAELVALPSRRARAAFIAGLGLGLPRLAWILHRRRATVVVVKRFDSVAVSEVKTWRLVAVVVTMCAVFVGVEGDGLLEVIRDAESLIGIGGVVYGLARWRRKRLDDNETRSH